MQPARFSLTEVPGVIGGNGRIDPQTDRAYYNSACAAPVAQAFTLITGEPWGGLRPPAATT
jgi:hypothetical protein